MNFRPGKFYKHENSKEAIVEVISIRRSGETCTVLNVSWWTPGYRIGSDTITVKHADETKWTQTTYDKEKTHKRWG